jgi:hypothetical protein
MARSPLAAAALAALLVARAADGAQTRCVKPGGGAGCEATIAAALALADSGDVVRVAAGTYVENVVLAENVTLEGGWNATFTARDPAAHVTAIEPDDPDFSVVAIQGSAVDPASSTPVRDGFKIRGGRADLGGNHGGGIRIRDSHAIVRDCVVTDNRASLFGGGIWVQRGAPRFERNRIVGNVAVGDGALGGGLAFETGAVAIDVVATDFADNAIEGDGGKGGAIHAADDTVLLVRGGRFEGNRAGSTCATGEGGAIRARMLAVRSATFRDDCAATGDAIAAAALSLYGSLFVASPPADPPVFVRTDWDVAGNVVQNSTFVWTGPTPLAAVQIADDDMNGSDGTLFENDLFVGVEIEEIDVARAYGERNVFADGAVPPPFLGTLAVADPMLDAEYRLLPGSPLVDAGVRGDSFRDVDGDPRPADGGAGRFEFDVGADELQGRPQRVFDLAYDAADLTIVGPGNPPENPGSIGTNDWIGRAVLAGDVSGDGADDLVVSAQDFADDFDDANAGGRLFGLRHFGARRTGTIDLASEPADFEVTCAIPLQHMGEELVAGDLDDDGVLDLVVGASDTHGDPAVRPKAIALRGSDPVAAVGGANAGG